MWGCPGSVSMIYPSFNLLGSQRQGQGFISTYLFSQRSQVTLRNTVTIRAVGISDMGTRLGYPTENAKTMYCAGEPMLGHLSRSFLPLTVASCATRRLCQPYTGSSLLPLAFWAHMLRDIAQKLCDRDGGEIHFTIAIMCIQLCHGTNQGAVEQNGQVVALPQTP